MALGVAKQILKLRPESNSVQITVKKAQEYLQKYINIQCLVKVKFIICGTSFKMPGMKTMTYNNKKSHQ
jgi:hypothetical protein